MASKTQIKTASPTQQASGKFTKEEREVLDEAIDKFISENYNCTREEAIRKLISKKGKNPSMLTLIGKKVLPNRPARSIYSYYRRHVVSHKIGKWSDAELLILLQSFFKPESYTGNCWRTVAKVLNRSPEQIHDKYREIKPYIQNYRSLITNPKLSDNEKIERIKSINKSCQNGDQDPPNNKVSDIIEQQQEIYDYVRFIMDNKRRRESIENIPWSKIQEKFPQYSTSKLRLHFNMSLLPKVYKTVYPGFGIKVVSRICIRWIRKLLKRPNSEMLRSLKDIDFKSKFPMLPVIYTTHCTRRALSKIIKKYKIHLNKKQRIFNDPDLNSFEIDELKDLNPNYLGKIFTNKYITNIIKFGYSELEVKRWKLHDKKLLKSIKRNVLPECSL